MPSVIDQTPFNEYVANGATFVFPYEFQLLSAGDLVVTADGVVVAPSEFNLLGVGEQSGGEVEFLVAPAADVVILLSREITLDRDTDYQPNGDLRADVLDRDLNRLWQALQQFFALTGGVVRAPYPEQLPELPAAAERANRLLSFDALGNPVAVAPALESVTALLLDLASTSDVVKGAALSGYNDALAYAAATAGGRLNALSNGTVSRQLYGANSLTRTPQARFGDVVDLDDWLNGDGVTNNDAAFGFLLTYMAANPGKTFRSRRGRVYAVSFNSQTIPANVRLRLEGAKFLWTGALGGSAATVLALSSGVDFDTLRFEITSGSTFRRMLQLNGAHRGDLVELVCQAQVNNNGGSNLDAGVRLYGQASRIGEVRTERVDRAVFVYGEGATAATSQKGTRIGFVEVLDYVTGFQIRNVEDFQLDGYRIRGRSANALPDPGHSGILTSGAIDARFGPGLVANAGEHNVRIGGSNGSECLTENVQFVSPIIRNSGQCGFKAWSGSNLVPINRLAVSNALVVDCGDNGDALGFNDFGMMIQNVVDGEFVGCQVVPDALANCALDGFYVSQGLRNHFEGARTRNALRNGFRISEFNGNGTDANGSIAVNVHGFHTEGHAAEGFFVECPATGMRDIMLTDAHIVGGTDGVRWSGAIGRSLQPCYFEGVIRGHSGVRFNTPASSGSNIIKTLDMLA